MNGTDHRGKKAAQIVPGILCAVLLVVAHWHVINIITYMFWMAAMKGSNVDLYPWDLLYPVFLLALVLIDIFVLTWLIIRLVRRYRK
jgi:hypothetical protein